MAVALGQLGHSVRFEWGRTGGLVVGERADVAVVVDVLTFTTTLTLAVERGTVVVPHPQDEPDLAAVAAQQGAVLAGDRGSGTDQPTVAPSSIVASDPVDRLLLPTRDGAGLCADLQSVATTVVAAGLRNAAAVASWIAREHDPQEAVVAVVAAGGRWADGSLRPALEDLWGAGAVLAALEDHEWPGLSPEAAQAADAYRLVAGREREHLLACASGQELAVAGHAGDVDLAAAVGASRVVPLLSDRGFVSAP
ncbi:2-phosphosulfolactate phosphatase [Aeromicrobium sp. CF4.19]|uniref:2-phosphosulfolactate phosphatase n=1 Tax=Aeromicrobium sp. CF4.19 TaxID=3373082 RepID=UPI003EE4283E